MTELGAESAFKEIFFLKKFQLLTLTRNGRSFMDFYHNEVFGLGFQISP